jgi:hypothetical protein
MKVEFRFNGGSRLVLTPQGEKEKTLLKLLSVERAVSIEASPNTDIDSLVLKFEIATEIEHG